MPQGNTGKSDLRQYRRTIARFNIRSTVLETHEVLEEVEVRDISIGGVRLYTRDPISQGAHLSLEFDRPDVGLKTSLRGEVMWTSAEENEPGFSSGLKFVDQDPYLSADVLKKVAAISAPEPAAAPSPESDDRRQTPRLEDSFPIRYRPATSWFGGWVEATLIDLSGSGLAFLASESVRVDEILDLDIQLPEAPERPRILSVVLSCEPAKQEPSKYRIGVNLVKASEKHQSILAEYLANKLQQRLEEDC